MNVRILRAAALLSLFALQSCSLLPDENHLQISRFLGRQSDAGVLAIEAPWGRPTGVGRQTLPGERTMDGFFYARLRKAPAP